MSVDYQMAYLKYCLDYSIHGVELCRLNNDLIVSRLASEAEARAMPDPPGWSEDNSGNMTNKTHKEAWAACRKLGKKRRKR